MKTTLSRKVGRPLKGAEKRIRTSFTLNPNLLLWLKNEARKNNMAKSEYLDNMIQNCQSQLKDRDLKEPLLKKIKIPVPLKQINQFCQKYHMAQMSLFGSVLTKYFTPQSDIDIVVKFKEGFEPGFFELIKMQNELQVIFNGREVDLKTPHELSHYFKEEVLKKAEVIYAHERQTS